MKKIEFSVLLFLSLFLFSCENQDVDFGKDLPQPENQKGLKSGGDNKWDHLGYGYDATGKFSSLNNMRAPVIDIDKYIQKYPKGPDVDKSLFVAGREAAGESAYTYISNFSRSWSLGGSSSNDETSKNLFTGNITSTYSNKSTYSSTYSFASKSTYYRQRRLSLFNSAAELQQYLSSAFITHVNTLSPDELVRMYGTHVLTRISLGAKIDYLYRSKIIVDKKETVVKSGMNAGIGKIFKSSINDSLSSNLDTRNEEQTLNYEIVGGRTNLAPSGSINLQMDKGIRDLTSWERSIDTTNMAFIEINDYGLIPIYDLIVDPGKKANVKAACENYILSKQLEEERLSNALYAGEILYPSTMLYSPNRLYALAIEHAIITLLKNGNKTWFLMYIPPFFTLNKVELTHEGELVVYTGKKNSKTSLSKISAGPNSKLVLDDSGNLTLYNQSEQRKWIKYSNGNTATF